MGDGGVACAVRAVEGFGSTALVLVKRGGGGEAMPDKGERGHGHHHQQHRKSQQLASPAELEEGELLSGEAGTNGLPERSMPPKKWRKVLMASAAASEVEPGEIVAAQAVPSRKASSRNGEPGKGDSVPQRPRKDQSGKSGRKSSKDEVEPGEITPLDKKHDGKSQRGDDHSRRQSSSAKKSSLRDSDEEPGEIKLDSSSSGSVRKSRASGHQDTKHQADTSDQSGSKTRWKGEGKSSSAGRHFPGRNREASPSIRDRHDRRDRSPGNLGGRFSHDRIRHDRYDRSPSRLDRSPRDRPRHYDSRDRSPYISPRHRPRQFHHRDSTPSRVDSSPHGRAHHEDVRDRSPPRHDKSPSERHHRATDTHDTIKKSRSAKLDTNNLEKPQLKSKSTKQSSTTKSASNGKTEEKISKEKAAESTQHTELPPPPPLPLPPPPPPPPPPPLPPVVLPPLPPPPESELNGVLAEDACMEEDMDICDTPPHPSVSPEPVEPTSDMGKWFYLDQFGIEQGPSKLVDLRKLVEEGYLLSDHLIKHADSDRWMTVENAASPLVPSDFPSVYSDASAQLVSPPEAPGNLLDEAPEVASQMEEASAEYEEDFYIDDRVEALMEGSILVHGQELESLGGL